LKAIRFQSVFVPGEIVNKFTAAAGFALVLMITPAVYAAGGVPVPEPSSFMMVGSGLIGLGGLFAFRRKR
jgi:PEP-CTERM motif